jgi:ferric-dicitrate binding protein FerR (iron transport regulator)
MFAAAAVVLLLAGIFTIYRLITRVPDRMEFVSAGAVVHDTLPDGTRITLNGKSKLTCPESFDDHYRETDLTGEAFFEVTHDPAHPFIVHAGSADIRVLGTSFVVKSSGNRTEVSVSEGRVRFYRIIPGTADTTAVVLEAGDHGVWQNGVPDPVITENIAPDVHFWANGSLEFRHTPLSDVFSLVERYYQVKISVSDPSILHCRLTASFVKEPADRMLGVIAESFGLTLVNNGQVFHFTGNGCSQENN